MKCHMILLGSYKSFFLVRKCLWASWKSGLPLLCFWGHSSEPLNIFDQSERVESSQQEVLFWFSFARHCHRKGWVCTIVKYLGPNKEKDRGKYIWQHVSLSDDRWEMDGDDSEAATGRPTWQMKHTHTHTRPALPFKNEGSKCVRFPSFHLNVCFSFCFLPNQTADIKISLGEREASLCWCVV